MLAHAYNYSIWEAKEIVGSRPTCDTQLYHLRETTYDTGLHHLRKTTCDIRLYHLRKTNQKRSKF